MSICRIYFFSPAFTRPISFIHPKKEKVNKRKKRKGLGKNEITTERKKSRKILLRLSFWGFLKKNISSFPFWRKRSQVFCNVWPAVRITRHLYSRKQLITWPGASGRIAIPPSLSADEPASQRFTNSWRLEHGAQEKYLHCSSGHLSFYIHATDHRLHHPWTILGLVKHGSCRHRHQIHVA